jgi:formylmethanofuran--tetrahydromethanopterin N-formyltransferase
MTATRLLITADSEWAATAAASLTGFATSVIACGCEAGIERALKPDETPDGRPGLAVLIFGMSAKDLQKQLRDRVGQCVLTCAGTACFAGIRDGPPLKLGGALRYFGDGHQISKRLGERRYWRIPVMDGEFVCDDTVGTTKAVGGGNILILGAPRRCWCRGSSGRGHARRAGGDPALPPGGIVRSGSKVGSKYKA